MSIALKWLAWFALMSLGTGWLAGSRLPTRPQPDPDLLRQPRSVLVIGLVTGGAFVALAVLSALFPGEDGSAWVRSGTGPGYP